MWLQSKDRHILVQRNEKKITTVNDTSVKTHLPLTPGNLPRYSTPVRQDAVINSAAEHLVTARRHTNTHPQQRLHRLGVKQSHDPMVPGQPCSHHEDANPTDEGGDVAHVGEAVPKRQHREPWIEGKQRYRQLLTRHRVLLNIDIRYRLNQHCSSSLPVCTQDAFSPTGPPPHRFSNSARVVGTHGCPASGLRTDWLIPRARRAWLQVSAKEWMASENMLAEPV